MSSGPLYPFSALVAQDDLKLCLMLLAVQPRLGGVLVRGDKGAAKSTAARSLAELMVDEGQTAPFINLPLGATEDRVVGTLDLERALKGEHALQRGLLAQAHGGVLYIDEVNLLPRHLVNLLLDAAAMGVHRVERDSLSIEAPSRFALIGSMNAEEGRLSPQLLDRFGLCADVQAPRDVTTRTQIVQLRLEFESDPEGFRRAYRREQTNLEHKLCDARNRLSNIKLSGEVLAYLAESVIDAQVSSLRADLVLAHGAKALAALEGADAVKTAHVDRVLPFVLAHRTSTPTSTPSPRRNQGPQPSPPKAAATPPPPEDGATPSKPTAAETPETGKQKSKLPGGKEQIFEIGKAPTALRDVDVKVTSNLRRQSEITEVELEPYSRRFPAAQPQHLAVADSVRHAVTQSTLVGKPFAGLTRDDLFGYELKNPRTRLLLMVDSSGSLAARKHMATVKGAIVALLEQLVQKDVELSLMSFRGTQATLNVPATHSVGDVIATLGALPTGGRTPLAHALKLASEELATLTDASYLLFTDGKCNVPLTKGGDPWQAALGAAAHLRPVRGTVIDTGGDEMRGGYAAELAEVLHARYLTI